MFSEFKTFIARGNVLDLAVGVIIGAAFGKIVTSLTEDIIMPIIGWLSGGASTFPAASSCSVPFPRTSRAILRKYADLKAAGVAMIGLGSFINAIINFLILAFVIFLHRAPGQQGSARSTRRPLRPPARARSTC